MTCACQAHDVFVEQMPAESELANAAPDGMLHKPETPPLSAYALFTREEWPKAVGTDSEIHRKWHEISHHERARFESDQRELKKLYMRQCADIYFWLSHELSKQMLVYRLRGNIGRGPSGDAGCTCSLLVAVPCSLVGR